LSAGALGAGAVAAGAGAGAAVWATAGVPDSATAAHTYDAHNKASKLVGSERRIRDFSADYSQGSECHRRLAIAGRLPERTQR
jgi:hypothetical protein